MNTLKPEVVKSLIDFRDKQLNLADEYETKQQYETAYLAIWAILEKFVKTVAYEYRREMLRKSLAEWTQYLDGKRDKRPDTSPKCTLDSISLPREKEFRSCLRYFGFNANDIWALMDSKGGFRIRRNVIAHHACQFGTPAKYEKMKSQMSDLIISTYEEFK